MRKILTLAIAMMITVCCFTQENWFDEDSLSGLPVSSLFSKAAWHKAHNHADTAMGFYLLIVRKMSSMPDTTSQRFCAQSCVELGNIYFEKGYYTEAFTSFTTAIKIAENNRFEHMLPQIYNNIGKIYCTWNDQTRGIEYFKKGLKHADWTDDVESYKSLSSTYSECTSANTCSTRPGNATTSSQP
ncbi:MAG TPA: tetratricopeptide repeat protein [Candidatus Avibacteroides excrementipullorum]|nr:tetratricopeptide repeat protein [Candidatus Avibacteroides excrementipullorum]